MPDPTPVLIDIIDRLAAEVSALRAALERIASHGDEGVPMCTFICADGMVEIARDALTRYPREGR